MFPRILVFCQKGKGGQVNHPNPKSISGGIPERRTPFRLKGQEIPVPDFSADLRKTRFHRFQLGLPSPTGPATVRLLKHRFLFGTNLFGLCHRQGTDLEAYQDRALGLVNAGTLPFYWGRYEPEEGKVDVQNVKAAALWARDRGITPKGHPLCWHTVCAEWLLDYDNDTILGKQLDRIRREVGTYRGLVDIWDVINEVVILPVFSKYDNAVTRLAHHVGAVELVLKCFQAAKESNPNAFLLINDFDLSDDYAQLIETLLDRGCPIDAIGLQTHQHEGYRGTEAVAGYLARFERFGLPLHFTENTILSGEPAPKVDDLNDVHRPDWPSTPEREALQARQAEEFYTQLYAHPLVESIVWWDLEDGNWLNAPGGLVRKDLSPKPAYHRLQNLIQEEWGFPPRVITPQAGRLEFTGPEGEYEIRIGEKTWRVALSPKVAGSDGPSAVLN